MQIVQTLRDNRYSYEVRIDMRVDMSYIEVIITKISETWKVLRTSVNNGNWENIDVRRLVDIQGNYIEKEKERWWMQNYMRTTIAWKLAST